MLLQNFLRMSAFFSRNGREKKRYGLSTGHSVCRAAPRDARALGQLRQGLTGKSINQRLPLDNSDRQASTRRGQSWGRAVSQWLEFLPSLRRGFQRPPPSRKSFKWLFYNHQTIYILYLNKTYLQCGCFIYPKC